MEAILSLINEFTTRLLVILAVLFVLVLLSMYILYLYVSSYEMIPSKPITSWQFVQKNVYFSFYPFLTHMDMCRLYDKVNLQTI